MKVKALVLRAPGINRDEDAAAAIELAGGRVSHCVFTQGIERPIEVPVAHGEGRFLSPGGGPADYPTNPHA